MKEFPSLWVSGTINIRFRNINLAKHQSSRGNVARARACAAGKFLQAQDQNMVYAPEAGSRRTL
jgi:hypothetical protein